MFVLGSKWVYKVKTNADGSVNQYKAHLIVQENQQEYDIDYEHIFSLVAKIPAV